MALDMKWQSCLAFVLMGGIEGWAGGGWGGWHVATNPRALTVIKCCSEYGPPAQGSINSCGLCVRMHSFSGSEKVLIFCARSARREGCATKVGGFNAKHGR